MRHGCWAVPLALLTFFAASPTQAQYAPRSAYQASYYNTYRNYYAQPDAPSSPSDLAPVPTDSLVSPPPVAHGAPYGHAESCDPVCANGCYAGNGCGCANGCQDACGCGDGEAEVWRLFGDVPLIPGAKKCGCRDPLSFFIGGWVQGGITGNADGNRSVSGNFPVPFNQVSDGFVFNQAPWIYAEKALDTGGDGFDWGVRVDYIFGTDGPDTQAFGDQGWDFGWNSSRDYGSAIPQLYLDLGYNNVSVRLGHFFTIIGYEVVPATGNFFYSHALMMNYGEPFTHTGALGKYTPDDAWTFYGGYTMGWDSGWENRGDANTFLGGVSYAWEDIGTITWACNTGRFGDGGPLPGGGVAAAGDIYINSFVASLNVTDNIVYVFQHDYSTNWNIPGAESAQWYGINQYLFITLTDEVKFGARFEWFDDQDGVRIGPANPAGAGAEGDYYEATIGLNVAPHPNFMVRPELRWDWFSGTAPPGALPYDNGTSSNLFTAGVDGILQF